MKPLYLQLALAAMMLIACAPAMAQRAVNRGLHAVPAPDKVVIDGKLDEWDTSGAIICCKDVSALLDVESCRVAAMHDGDNLYLSFAFRDPTPMVNKIDPATMRGNGWRSDAVQLRCNMEGFVSHIDAWYFTARKEPAMDTQYGRIGGGGIGQPEVDRPTDPTKLGAEQAFRIDDDGRGYVQEMKIPWGIMTLDGKTPPKGADLRLGLELFWGGVTADGWPRSRVTDNLSESAKTTDFFWTSINNWGKLILEDKNNITLPAPSWQLATKAEPKALVPITFALPRDGHVTVAIEDLAGNRVKSLLGGIEFAKGTHTVYWSGLTDRDELLPAGRYRWTGIYRDKIDVQWKMSFYQPNQRSPWLNSKGTGAWGPDHGHLQAAATGGGRVYFCGNGVEAGFAILAVDENGNKLWSLKDPESSRLAYADGMVYACTRGGTANWIGIAPVGVMRFKADTGEWIDITGPDGKPARRLPLVPEGEQVVGFAADKNGLYVSVAGKNVVRSFDRNTFKQMREYKVPGAAQLFAPGDGTLLVTSSKGLLWLDLAGRRGDVATLNAEDFSSARDVTAAADRIYVAMGAPDHRVHVFTREGKRIGTIGNEGGRKQNGWYEPREGFLNPNGLAVDSNGRLWVVEDSYRPKRTSVWKDGKWQRDFIGDTGYGGGGVINPLDPTMAFYNGMQFEIDIDKRTWKLVQVGMIMPANAAEFGLEQIGNPNETGQGNTTEYMMAHRGRAYIHKCRGSRHIYRQREDGRWALCVYIDTTNKVAWMDLNDDCLIQNNEIVRGGADDIWGGNDYWGTRPSQNLDLYFSRRVDTPGLRLRLERITPGGTPIYDFAKFEEMAGECMNGIGLRDGTFNSGCAGERGEYFSEMRKTQPAGVDRRTFWFRGLNTGRWTYRLPEPGVVIYPFQAHGVANVPELPGEVVCWVSDFGQRYLFTDDMLYVDQLFADGRASYDAWPEVPEPGFIANNMTPGQESFHGFFTRAAGNRYLLTSGFTDCRVFEITGLNSLRRIGGETEIKPEHLGRAIDIRDFRLSGGKTRGTARIARVARPMGIDGTLQGWNRDDALRIKVDADRAAEILTAYDQDNLYVAWEVRDNSPMFNNAERWELAFKGGDAVDVMFRAPGKDLDKAGVRAGDLRLLIAGLGGKPAAVLYRPVSENKKPFVFDAFEGAGRGNAVRMDEVRLAPEVRAVIKRGPSGYIVEAAIPWKLLGIGPAAGAEGRIDFGVLFSDAKGTGTAVRAYWENRDTQIVADIPSEAQLKPANWGIMKLEE